MEKFMVPAVDPGISLYVRNKHPQGAEKFTGEKILLYVHGATYPAASDFVLGFAIKIQTHQCIGPNEFNIQLDHTN